MSKTALQELIEWVMEELSVVEKIKTIKEESRYKSDYIEGAITKLKYAIKKAQSLLPKEKDQMELAALWAANFAIDNMGNKDVDSGKAFDDYFTNTFNQ